MNMDGQYKTTHKFWWKLRKTQTNGVVSVATSNIKILQKTIQSLTLYIKRLKT